MCSTNISVLVVLVLVSTVLAAPKPIDFDEVGRKIHDFGLKALPALRGVCGFINSYQGYSQGYPQAYSQSYPQLYPQTYPQGYPQGYPQAYPQQPNSLDQGFYPQFSKTFPTNFGGQSPSKTPTEQDDLNKFNPTTNVQLPPPQIQDILKNFDKLPKIDTKNLRDAENNVL